MQLPPLAVASARDTRRHSLPASLALRAFAAPHEAGDEASDETEPRAGALQRSRSKSCPAKTDDWRRALQQAAAAPQAAPESSSATAAAAVGEATWAKRPAFLSVLEEAVREYEEGKLEAEREAEREAECACAQRVHALMAQQPERVWRGLRDAVHVRREEREKMLLAARRRESRVILKMPMPAADAQGDAVEPETRRRASLGDPRKATTALSATVAACTTPRRRSMPEASCGAGAPRLADEMKRREVLRLHQAFVKEERLGRTGGGGGGGGGAGAGGNASKHDWRKLLMASSGDHSFASVLRACYPTASPRELEQMMEWAAPKKAEQRKELTEEQKEEARQLFVGFDADGARAKH